MNNSVTAALEKAKKHLQDFRLWTDEERERSMRQALATAPDPNNIWIFGYGSLVWRPEFEYTDRLLATVKGYHRSLCLWSSVNRGTPERPGLVFGLDIGGSCLGCIYRLDTQNIESDFIALWKREMPSSGYIPLWLNCETEKGIVPALVFAMDPETPSYSGKLSEEEILEIVLGAKGVYGHCKEYVVETAYALEKNHIHDEALKNLCLKLEKREAT